MALSKEAASIERLHKLEQMYLAASPINAFYSLEIWISHGKAQISILLKPEFFHAAAVSVLQAPRLQ